MYSPYFKQIAEEERNKKLIKHNEELLKGKSFFEIISFFAKQGAVEFKKLLDECKESSDDDYRFYYFLVISVLFRYESSYCLFFIDDLKESD
jgi:hypothetical protein